MTWRLGIANETAHHAKFKAGPGEEGLMDETHLPQV